MLLAGSKLISVTPPNLPPEWTSTPDVVFQDGVGGSIDLDAHTTDPEGDPRTYALNGSSAALPTGVTISGSSLVGSGAVSEGITAGIIIDVDDGVNNAVPSDTFSIDVRSDGWTPGGTPHTPVVPGCFSRGSDQVAGSGRHLGTTRTQVYFVTTLDESGVGSLAYGLVTLTGPRVIIPAISGVIEFTLGTILVVTDPYVSYWGQCAPGDGLFIQGATVWMATDDWMLWHLPICLDNQATGSVDCITTTNGDRGLIANCTFAFGQDECVDFYNSTTEMGIWQSHIAFPLRVARNSTIAAGMLGSSTADQMSALRGFYNHCDARIPLVAGDDVEASQNIIYATRESAGLLNVFGDTSQTNWRRNLFIEGNHVFFRALHILDRENAVWQPGSTVYESDNEIIATLGSPTVGEITNEPSVSFEGSPIASCTPPGWVEHPFSVATQAAQLEYANLFFSHCGAYPNNRIQLFQQAFDWAINKINGLTGEANLGPWFIDFPSEVGGLPVIAMTTIDHEAGGPVGAIPAGTNRTNEDWGYIADFSGSPYSVLEDWGHAYNGEQLPTGWDN